MRFSHARRSPGPAAGALLALAAAACGGSRGAAPPQTAAQPAAACDSAYLTAPHDTVLAVARAELRGPSDTTRLPEPYAELVLQAIREQLVPPSPLVLPAYTIGVPAVSGDSIERATGTRPAVVVRHAAPEAIPGAYLEFRLHMRPDGHIEEATLLTTSLSPELDASVYRAVLRADSLGALPPVLAGDPPPPEYLWLGVGIGLDSARYSIPWFRAEVPVLSRVTFPAHGRGLHPPLYPSARQGEGLGGKVDVRFVVDETGHPVSGTYALRRLADVEFGKAVFRVLPRYEFTPARIAGCPVKTLVTLPFIFSAGRDPVPAER